MLNALDEFFIGTLSLSRVFKLVETRTFSFASCQFLRPLKSLDMNAITVHSPAEKKESRKEFMREGSFRSLREKFEISVALYVDTQMFVDQR